MSWLTPNGSMNSSNAFPDVSSTLLAEHKQNTCNKPLIPWIPLPDGVHKPQLLENGRLCVENCCVNCYDYVNISPLVTKLQHLTHCCSFIIYFASLFILVSHLVNPKLTISMYAGLQAMAFMCLSGIMGFGTVGKPQNVFRALCLDDITPNIGLNNSRCLAQGVMYVFGLHSVMLSITARVFSSMCRLVLSKQAPQLLITVVVCGVSAIFGGIAFRYTLYVGGPVCTCNIQTSMAMIKAPCILYSFVGLVMVAIMSCSVTLTLYQISVNLKRSRISSGSDLKIGLLTRLRIFCTSYLRAVRLVWRTYLCSLYLLSMSISQLSFTHEHPDSRTGGMRTIPWVQCVFAHGEGHCEHLEGSDGSWARRMVCTSVMVLLGLIFPISEMRTFMFKGWWRLIRNPGCVFNRRRSSALLDALRAEIREKRQEPPRRELVLNFLHIGMTGYSRHSSQFEEQLNRFALYNERQREGNEQCEHDQEQVQNYQEDEQNGPIDQSCSPNKKSSHSKSESRLTNASCDSGYTTRKQSVSSGMASTLLDPVDVLRSMHEVLSEDRDNDSETSLDIMEFLSQGESNWRKCR